VGPTSARVKRRTSSPRSSQILGLFDEEITPGIQVGCDLNMPLLWSSKIFGAWCCKYGAPDGAEGSAARFDSQSNPFFTGGRASLLNCADDSGNS